MWSIRTLEYYSVRKKGSSTHALTWMKLENMAPDTKGRVLDGSVTGKSRTGKSTEAESGLVVF